MGSTIYVFGGRSGSTLLNDLFAFDTVRVGLLANTVRKNANAARYSTRVALSGCVQLCKLRKPLVIMIIMSAIDNCFSRVH